MVRSEIEDLEEEFEESCREVDGSISREYGLVTCDLGTRKMRFDKNNVDNNTQASLIGPRVSAQLENVERFTVEKGKGVIREDKMVAEKTGQNNLKVNE